MLGAKHANLMYECIAHVLTPTSIHKIILKYIIPQFGTKVTCQSCHISFMTTLAGHSARQHSYNLMCSGREPTKAFTLFYRYPSL